MLFKLKYQKFNLKYLNFKIKYLTFEYVIYLTARQYDIFSLQECIKTVDGIIYYLYNYIIKQLDSKIFNLYSIQISEV